MYDDLISVIIPVYNVEKYLKRCVKSVLEQNNVNYEIILVDDGSTDGSATLCDEIKKNHEKIVKVIHKQNEGLGYARNSGLDIAQGEYIFFLDSDDWIVPGALANLLSIAKENDVDMVCFQFERVNKEVFSMEKQPEMVKKVVNNSGLMREYLVNMAATAWSKFYKKEIFNQDRFSNVKLYEDAYSMHLFMQHVNKAAIVNQVFYIQYIRRGSLTQTKFREENFISLECGKRIVGFINENYSELIDYAYFNLLERQIGMIDLITTSFVYRTYRKQCREIILEIENELPRIREKKEINVKLWSSAEELIKHSYRYILRKELESVFYNMRIGITDIIKKWRKY